MFSFGLFSVAVNLGIVQALSLRCDAPLMTPFDEFWPKLRASIQEFFFILNRPSRLLTRPLCLGAWVERVLANYCSSQQPLNCVCLLHCKNCRFPLCSFSHCSFTVIFKVTQCMQWITAVALVFSSVFEFSVGWWGIILRTSWNVTPVSYLLKAP